MAAGPVLSIGETLIDLIASDGAPDLESVGAFVAREGGAPANVVVALARLGVESAFCGVVGDDPFGARLRRVLAADNVDISRLRSTSDADTTIAFAWKDARGDGHFRLLRMADVLLNDTDIDRADIGACAAIVVGSVSLAEEPSRSAVTRAVKIAAENGVPVCFDVNMRPTIWTSVEQAREACAPILERATLLKLSLDDAKFLFDPGIEADGALTRARETGARFVVLTDGGRGAWFAMKEQDVAAADRFVSAFQVEAIEPTGAGDAFNAGIISGLIANEWTTLTVADVRFAAAAGALTTTRRGAIDSLPARAEIEAFVARAG